MALIGIAHFAPLLEPNDDYAMVCVGISGYWAGEDSTPKLEDSPIFDDVHSALEWAEPRARIVLIRVSMNGQTYQFGEPYSDPTTSYLPLDLDKAEAEFEAILGKVVH